MDKKILDALTDENVGQGFLKAGILGFAKSGKSFTAALLAVAVKVRFKLPGQIAMFDTEGGSVYLDPVIQKLTGGKILPKRARSFDAMCAWGRACVSAGVSVAIVDSVTHPWRELCESYLAQVNAYRKSRGWGEQQKIEFQDWAVLKSRWQEWTDFYLNAPLHIVICGRAGDVYEQQVNEKGKKEIVKTGDMKMKTETEFGFEPSLLVELTRDERQRNGEVETCRIAQVVGDRFSVIDAKRQIFWSVNAGKQVELESALKAVDDFFGPHLDLLTPGDHGQIDMVNKTAFEVADGGEEWQSEKKSRTILCEEIEGELVKAYPGQTKDEKQAKMALIEECFGTRSWTKVESTSSAVLREGLKQLRAKLSERTVAAAG